MALLFELLFPLLWLGLGISLWRKDRWQGSLFVAFYFVCLALEAVAIRFGEYYYGPMAVEICPPGPLWRAASACPPQPNLCLPLAVPCMEAIFFFAGWIWAAGREKNPLLRPLAAALVAVIADLAFDPVAARGVQCGPGGESFEGIGLWTWLLDPADPGHYFGIPVDNPLAWLASCAGFGYAALLLPRWLKRDQRRLGTAGLAGLAALVSMLGLVFAGIFFLVLDLVVTPPGSGVAYRLTALFAMLGGLYVWLLSRAWRSRPAAGDRGLDLAAVAVLAASLLYALLAMALGYDQQVLYPLWAIVAGTLAAYWAAVRRPSGP
jgi:hypothetical protein